MQSHLYSDEQLATWMGEAIALARAAAARDEVPVGALFVNDGKILACGANRREELHRATGHAEIVALDAYSEATKQWRLPTGTILIATAEPCLMCTGALIWARVERIFYGCSDPRNAGMRNVLPLVERGVFDHRFVEARGGIRAEECSEMMSAFFKAKRIKF